MRDEADEEVEALLRVAREEPIPEPRPELIGRTLRRIRLWFVFADLLRLATFGGLWRTAARADDNARPHEARQTP